MEPKVGFLLAIFALGALVSGLEASKAAAFLSIISKWIVTMDWWCFHNFKMTFTNSISILSMKPSIS